MASVMTKKLPSKVRKEELAACACAWEVEGPGWLPAMWLVAAARPVCSAAQSGLVSGAWLCCGA